MSPEAISQVELIGFPSSPNISNEIQESLDPVPVVTIYFLFNETWWTGSRPEHSDVLTDLPIRRVKYIGTSRLKSDRDNSTSGGSGSRSYGHLFMVTSADHNDVDYFRPFIETVGSDNIVRLPCNMSLQTITDITRQIARVHGLPEQQQVPLPIAMAVKDWSKEPYGGGWHMWKRGVRWDQVAQRLQKPFDDENLFLAGSGLCPGSCQFWLEGALQTVDEIFERYFEERNVTTTVEYEIGDKEKVPETMASYEDGTLKKPASPP